MTMFFSIRAVTHQQANANRGGQFSQACEVGSTIINWGEIELEVARMHNHTLRSVNDDCVCVWHRVSNGQELNIERADIDALTITHCDEAGVF